MQITYLLQLALFPFGECQKQVRNIGYVVIFINFLEREIIFYNESVIYFLFPK